MKILWNKFLLILFPRFHWGSSLHIILRSVSGATSMSSRGPQSLGLSGTHSPGSPAASPTLHLLSQHIPRWGILCCSFTRGPLSPCESHTTALVSSRICSEVISESPQLTEPLLVCLPPHPPLSCVVSIPSVSVRFQNSLCFFSFKLLSPCGM